VVEDFSVLMVRFLMAVHSERAKPILYYDPTSEPSRAVYWFALEAGIPIDLRYTWLTRGEHLSQELLEVNPCHQVPALWDGDFCLSEASAIMLYLAETDNSIDRWRYRLGS